jgi:hypothetical protein
MDFGEQLINPTTLSSFRKKIESLVQIHSLAIVLARRLHLNDLNEGMKIYAFVLHLPFHMEILNNFDPILFLNNTLNIL